jgi:hypothetical protein
MLARRVNFRAVECRAGQAGPPARVKADFLPGALQPPIGLHVTKAAFENYDLLHYPVYLFFL